METEASDTKILPLSIVVTGGASGIGEAVVRLYVGKGVPAIPGDHGPIMADTSNTKCLADEIMRN